MYCVSLAIVKDIVAKGRSAPFGLGGVMLVARATSFMIHIAQAVGLCHIELSSSVISMLDPVLLVLVGCLHNDQPNTLFPSTS